MGYFDAFTVNLFRVDRDGRRVIAPFGALGRVYLVPSDDDAARIRAGVQRLYQILLGAIIASQLLGGWRWSLIAGLVALAGFYGGMHVLTRRLPMAGVAVKELTPVSRGEMQARYARALGRRWLIAGVGIAALFVGVGIWLGVRTGDARMWLTAGFFALCGAVSAYQLLRARR